MVVFVYHIQNFLYHKKKLQKTSKQNNVCQQKDDFAKHADIISPGKQLLQNFILK